MTIQSRAAAVQAEFDLHVAALKAAGRKIKGSEPEPHEPLGLPEPKAPGETMYPAGAFSVIAKKRNEP